MKFVLILAAALALAACNKSAPAPAASVPGVTVSQPVEGVYPDCKYGVYAPDDVRAPGCIVPRD